MRHLVAVYGTLKQGCNNHHLLRGARLLGTDTLTGLTLYSLGAYPAALAKPSDGVRVEIYAVNEPQLAMLDELEDYDRRARKASLYLRKRIQTRFGLAWIYLYNRPVQSRQRIASGDW